MESCATSRGASEVETTAGVKKRALTQARREQNRAAQKIYRVSLHLLFPFLIPRRPLRERTPAIPNGHLYGASAQRRLTGLRPGGARRLRQPVRVPIALLQPDGDDAGRPAPACGRCPGPRSSGCDDHDRQQGRGGGSGSAGQPAPNLGPDPGTAPRQLGSDPLSLFRDRVILLSAALPHQFNLTELKTDIYVSGALRVATAGADDGNSNRSTVGGGRSRQPWEPRSWEVSGWFLRKWSLAIDDGSREMLREVA
ncbi:hypothetical protein PG985_013805 [Apiospora marii]|uniref:BZIP domain-containing protein n=1 Tax=Apiospora marii TaxID=335849 RepID=A0ABR1R6R0_9PEZI